jgi:hypothetical protein
MEKLIIWFIPKDRKKHQLNQFHVLAKNTDEALNIFYKNILFDYSLMGVSKYEKVNCNSNEFINCKFY